MCSPCEPNKDMPEELPDHLHHIRFRISGPQACVLIKKHRIPLLHSQFVQSDSLALKLTYSLKRLGNEPDWVASQVSVQTGPGIS